MRTLAVVTAVAIVSIPEHASAEVVQYAFTGEITTISSNQGNVLGNLSIGDPFDGMFAFDLAVPDGNPGSNVGSYKQSGLMTVNLPELSIEYSGHLYISVVNDALDRFSIGVDNFFDDLNVSNFGVFLQDWTASVFESDALPHELQLADFDIRMFQMSGFRISTHDNFQIVGVLTSLTLVPAPSTAIIALAFLCVPRRRRARHAA